MQREHPAGGDLEAGGVEDLAADVGVQAEQVEPGGVLRRGVPPRRRRRAVIEKPNFWSSCAVAMYSWVCASTPAVTRTITRAVAARSRAAIVGQPLDLVERVDDDPADAGLDRAAQLGDGLVVAVEADPGRVEAGAQRDGQLAAGADVEAEPLLGDPARRPSCRGTPCRRRRRRTSANASRKARARARKSASSRTYAGVPCSATRSATATPADVQHAVDLVRGRATTGAGPGR